MSYQICIDPADHNKKRGVISITPQPSSLPPVKRPDHSKN
ncbi:hypothetical protein SynMITS9220_00875 [Synechococcus sp. MIT S9220]|nr:hypothetical protein SynMITS9220_00875 [Synechococcus sp. MIT S9220]